MAKNNKDIADQYAKAIFELASEQDNVETIKVSLQTIQTVLQDNQTLVKILTSTQVTDDIKQSLLATLTDFAPESVKNLIQLLAYNERLNILHLVIEQFMHAYNRMHGIVDVEATTSVPLNEERLQRLAKVFAQKTGAKKVNVSNTIDESILGGVILQSESTLIDGSLKTKIAKFKAQLLG
ncbi:ATP synthase F1 subunit delta [Leuconostoc fallax]|uniref:ATP synthase subunit delta n=1 Tax=Leuconostoc fallax TaxID=1251 RepID=A0A4R5N9M1_9LACO|nr:ATP synthase F1 subunit delta [Leuconostoc fallax]MBU7456002.1 F0F1 ATP synthase subunit delta [Leuconostoc fallax]TDG68846.1 hypothetical protein C5L23_000765 [Leuconostoc fallax]